MLNDPNNTLQAISDTVMMIMNDIRWKALGCLISTLLPPTGILLGAIFHMQSLPWGLNAVVRVTAHHRTQSANNSGLPTLIKSLVTYVLIVHNGSKHLKMSPELVFESELLLTSCPTV